MFAQFGLLVNS